MHAMNRFPPTARIPLSCRIIPIEQSRLTAMRPHILRLRATRTAPGAAQVRMGHLQDGVLAGSTFSAMVYDIARIVSGSLGQSDRLLHGRPLEVEVRPFGDDPLPEGPAVEVIVCLHESEGVLLEVCLDGISSQGSSGDWIVDALVATSWGLLKTDA